MQNQLLSGKKLATAANDSPNPNAPTNAAEFKPLVLGSTPVDRMLRRFQVPAKGILHVEFADDQAQDTFLLSACLAALSRGEKATFVYIPDSSERDEDVRAGREIHTVFESWMALFGLGTYVNATVPDDPTSSLRYLAARTLEEFESVLETLVGEPVLPAESADEPVVPDLIVVYGLENLFEGRAHTGEWAEDYLVEDGAQVTLAKAQQEQLRRWLQEHSALCEQKGISLWLGHDQPGSSNIARRGLSHLLYAHCCTGLLVKRRIDAERSRLGELPIFLYEFDALQGLVRAPVLAYDYGFDGPFINAPHTSAHPEDNGSGHAQSGQPQTLGEIADALQESVQGHRSS